jgi:hypothetical protein
MSGSFFYALVRRWVDDDAIEAAPADRGDVRATLWPGAEPPAHAEHPGLARCEASGVVGGRPMWVESRPLGAALSELAPALTRAECARVLVDVREALQALHAVGQAHGGVRASRIVIGTDGVATLIGVGQDRGTVERDVADLARLTASLGFGDLRDVEREADAPVRRAVVEASLRQPDPNETIELGTGGVDEVNVDLGPDERGAGLLERWSAEATSGGEPTRAPNASAPALVAPEILDVTISAPRAAIPVDRTSPRVDPEPSPLAEVTVTEVGSTGRLSWVLTLAAIAMLIVAMALTLVR